MSWDVYVQDIPSEARTPDDIPDDFQPVGLGLERQAVRDVARRVGGSVDELLELRCQRDVLGPVLADGSGVPGNGTRTRGR